MQHQTAGLLTQWRRVLLQNPQVPQTSCNSPLLWNHQLYYVITTTCHISLSWVSSIHSTLSRNCFCWILSQINPLHTFIHFVTTLQSSPGYAKRPLSLGFPHQNLVCALLSPIPATCSVHPLPDFISRIIFCEECRSSSSSLCHTHHSPDTSSLLGPKYIPLCPVFEHPQATFLPQYKKPCFTTI
jgi:hypothetical protein